MGTKSYKDFHFMKKTYETVYKKKNKKQNKAEEERD